MEGLWTIWRERTTATMSRPERKRLNVTVNEDLVKVAQSYTGNLSQTIEDLLAGWILVKREERRNDAEHWKQVAVYHDALVEQYGLCGAEYSRGFYEDGDGEDVA